MPRPDTGSRVPLLLRKLAALLVRGPGAHIVLGDLDEAYGREVERGMPPGRARRRYLRNALGSGFSLWRSRMSLRVPAMSWLDVKLGLRMLPRHPGLTVVAVFALAIGIPASMIPFHVVRAFRTNLPVDEGERIVGVETRTIRTSRRTPNTLQDFELWRNELTSFQALGAAHSASYNVISEDGGAAPVRGSEVTASTFRLLRVAPFLGRPLEASDQVPGAPDVVVVAYDLWHSRLGGDPDVVGRTIRVGGVPREVVGVMPKGFLFPFADHLWLPLRERALDYPPGGGPGLTVYGRLKDGVAVEDADAEVGRVGRHLAADDPQGHGSIRSAVLPYTVMAVGSDVSGDRDFYVMEVVAMILLLVACGNVGVLILARTASRTGELAVRTALGASRTRVLAQLFVEALVLSVLAVGVGLVIADVLEHRLIRYFEVPYFVNLGVTGRTVAWSLVLAAGSAVIAGVVPALRATGGGIQRTLQRAAAGASGLRFGGLSTFLIVSEVAFSVCFLALGGSVVRWALRDRSAGMGIAAYEYLSAEFTVPWTDPTADQAGTWQHRFRGRVAARQRELVRRLEAEPGVRGVALTSALPGHDQHKTRIEVEGGSGTDAERGRQVLMATVDVDYLAGLGQAARSGRDFTAADVSTPAGDRTAAIVNTSFVRSVLGGRNALGRRFRYVPRQGEKAGPWLEIVGVVGHLGMDEAAPEEDAGFYVPAAPGELNPVEVAIHLEGDPLAFAPRLRRIALEVDASAMVGEVSSMTQVYSERRLASRWLSLFLGLLSSIAILLASAGLHALIAFTVSQRTREIGIRTALGAHPRAIVATVARRAFLQLAAGVLLGAALSSVVVPHLLGRDVRAAGWPWPAVVSAVGALTLVVGLLACVPPTLRGLRVRPAEALKEG